MLVAYTVIGIYVLYMYEIDWIGNGLLEVNRFAVIKKIKISNSCQRLIGPSFETVSNGKPPLKVVGIDSLAQLETVRLC